MVVLVTGGAGYIGSHAARRLLADGHSVVIIDNLSCGHIGAINALRTLPGADKRLAYIECDIADRHCVEKVLRDHKVEAVIHFAAFADLRESVFNPLKYYDNNTARAIAFLQACDAVGIQKFIFSSTCATYGELAPEFIPISEDYPHRAPINPYGHSKLALEWALLDYADAQRRANKPFACAILRYFNVAGCDTHGLLGEHRVPHIRIVPILCEAALGYRDHITIFGTDYPTPDGTCVRDYIHVDDLVDAHIAVMNDLKSSGGGDARAYNLGLGRGTSILELIEATKRVTGANFEVRRGPRAPGDPANLYCNTAKIERELNWKPRITSTDDIIASAYNWMKQHPKGYAK